MRIKINADGRRFSISLPNSLLLNSLSVRIASSALSKNSDVKLDRADLQRIVDELRRLKKLRGPLELVNVEAADGTRVYICL